MRRIYSALLLALLVGVAPAHAQRLSGTVTPDHYTLWFAPDLEKETFRGRETIAVQVKSATPTITLHAAEITFDTVTVAAGGRTQNARVSTNEADETATFTVPQPIPPGPATIQVTYTGILNDKLRGFYISKANGRKYAVTQMEATDARRAFPSFDEPAMKATFDISLQIATGDSAISNGRQLSDVPGPEPGTHTLTFARTPKMSSYLVAMLVGDFVCRSGASDGIAIRICSTPDKLPLTAFALEAAEQQVAFFNKYTGIKYNFGKLDIVGVPDFAAGAMENVGAITFRERMLLVDPERASLNVKQGVASVIAHEIAHQWFGNLVTMKWWDDLWLNEGFATWMANKPLAAWKPEWKMELLDAADTQSALSIDALRSTRPIRTKAETPSEINELFDGIAYEKTAAVLRMVEMFVGPQSFQKAIQSYLLKYSYGNATGEDFWTEAAKVTGKPVDRIVKSFVDQPGAPVLKVETACNGGRSTITATQEQFVGSPGATPSAATWTFPACFVTPGGQPRCELVDRRSIEVTGGACGNVFANASSLGYYFTEYAPSEVRALGRNAKALAPTERLNLLSNEWWMVRSGRHEIGPYLDVAGELATDPTPQVIDEIGARLAFTANSLLTGEQLPTFQSWVRQKFGPALDAVGTTGRTGENEETQDRRAGLLSIVGTTGQDEAVQRRARELAAGYIANPASLSGTVAPTVLRVAALAGDRALYDQYVAQLEKLGSQPEEYYRFFNALTAFRDPALVTRTLEFSLSPAVRTQDTGNLVAGLLARPDSRDAAWSFVMSRWPTLMEKLGVFQGIPQIVSALGGFCSTESAAEIRQFFQKNPVPAVERTLQQAIERVENCAAVRTRQSSALSRWMTTAATNKM